MSMLEQHEEEKRNTHRKAIITITVAMSLDLLAALIFSATEHISFALSVYWSITTATTVGYGDVSPKTGLGHVVAVVVMLTVIPLFAATFSLFTSVMTTDRVHKSEARTMDHLHHITEHLGLPRHEPGKKEAA